MNSTHKWQNLVDFVSKHSCQWSKEPNEINGEWGIHQMDDPPHNRLLGPVFSRGDANGVIWQHGHEVFHWGDPDRADMTFSVTKTYLALTAGVAHDRGLLKDLDEPVVNRVPGIGFDTGNNRLVTWRHLLQFTSEWEGTCFGVPEQIDRNRVVSLQPVKSGARKGDPRPLNKPGSWWEYNDVRINQFALALLHLLQESLPDVFNKSIMQPLGASDTWSWHGYENSWVEIGGKRVQSVPGGGHWGGGMVISARDQARVARLLLNSGNHEGKQLVSTEWLGMMQQPCSIAPFYGFFTWLNTDHAISQAASVQSYFAMGIGGQLVWHDPVRQLVVVLRWIDSDYLDQYIQLILELLEE